MIREGRLLPLGTTGSNPHPALPGVPPIASAGLSDYDITMARDCRSNNAQLRLATG
jgi:hypothetical protein